MKEKAEKKARRRKKLRLLSSLSCNSQEVLNKKEKPRSYNSPKKTTSKTILYSVFQSFAFSGSSNRIFLLYRLRLPCNVYLVVSKIATRSVALYTATVSCDHSHIYQYTWSVTRYGSLVRCLSRNMLEKTNSPLLLFCCFYIYIMVTSYRDIYLTH